MVCAPAPISALRSKHFEHRLKTTGGTVGDYLAIEELRGRFTQWAAYIGGFAAPRASLDARLARHEDMRDMMLELLTIHGPRRLSIVGQPRQRF